LNSSAAAAQQQRSSSSAAAAQQQRTTATSNNGTCRREACAPADDGGDVKRGHPQDADSGDAHQALHRHTGPSDVELGLNVSWRARPSSRIGRRIVRSNCTFQALRYYCNQRAHDSSTYTPRTPTPTPPPPTHKPSQDLYQHNVWTVKTKGAEAAAASRMKEVDFSDFYKKFGVMGDDDEVAGDSGDGSVGSGSAKAGGGSSSSSSSSRSGRRR